MSDFSNFTYPALQTRIPTGYVLSTFGLESPLGEWSRDMGYVAYAFTAWGTANLAVYVPVWVPFSCTATKLLTSYGSTVSGNVDVGIYADSSGQPGSRLTSAGSTAMGSANTVQEFDVADQALTGGTLYWFAMACSATTSTVNCFTFSANACYIGRTVPLFTQTSALPLPSTATPAVPSAAFQAPLITATLTTTV